MNKLFALSLIALPCFYFQSASAFTPEEEQAIIDSVKQTTPGTTTTMSPGNAVIATVAEREALIQQNVSLGMSYAEATSKVDSLYQGGSGGPRKIIVTEKVPGAQCICIADGAGATEDAAGNYTAGVGEAACGNAETRKYECTLDSAGLTSFQRLIAAITKWFIYITMLLGVLALVGAGILWAWGSESEEYTKKAKGWAINIIIGLAILFSFRYILSFLAPWIFM